MSIALVETHYQVQLPEGYRKLYMEGAKGDWLWVFEAEWLTADEMIEAEMGRDRYLPGLIPFAATAAGDHWCWTTANATEPGEYEVLLCNHDEEQATVYAPSFPAWLYRVCLEFANCAIENDPDEIEEGRSFLREWSAGLDGMGSKVWAKHVAELAEATPLEFPDFKPNAFASEPPFSLLSDDDLERLIRGRLGSRYTGTTTDWGWYDE